MRQGKVSEESGDTWLFPPWLKVLHFASLSLRIMPLLNLVAVNIAGWGYLIEMHSYMMPKL